MTDVKTSLIGPLRLGRFETLLTNLRQETENGNIQLIQLFSPLPPLSVSVLPPPPFTPTPTYHVSGVGGGDKEEGGGQVGGRVGWGGGFKQVSDCWLQVLPHAPSCSVMHTHACKHTRTPVQYIYTHLLP